MFAPRIPLLLYWVPVLRIYVAGQHEGWEEYHSQLMDGMRYVFIPSFAFIDFSLLG
jgi:hypothetical protein